MSRERSLPDAKCRPPRNRNATLCCGSCSSPLDRHGLTEAEFAIDELVSQGRYTNNEVGRQLFISRHTVTFHLKKVSQKMSLASRVELAATWRVAV